MLVVSFSDCYFYSASYYTSAYEYVLPNSFSASFPSNLSSGGAVDIYVANFMSSDQSTVRTYDFSYAMTFGDTPIYLCEITHFGDEPIPADVLELSAHYIYVSVEYTYGAAYESMVTFTFLDRNGLPPGLDYDFENSILGSANQFHLMNWLYDFGNTVYSFFPSISDFLNTQIIGQSFSWILTQGLLVYCGWVVVKFIVGAVK